MEQRTPNWSDLSQADNQPLRTYLSDEDYAQQARQFVDEVNQLLQKELQRITTDGQSLADVFWQHNKAMRSMKTRGNYGTRVRLVNDCFSAEWYENVFLKRLNSKPQSRYIAKGKESHQYPKSAFKKANRSWEKELIEQIEQRYAQLRAQAALVYEIRKSVKKYQKIILKVYGEV